MKQFVFVYNADSGVFNKSIDFLHKIVSPSTYSCSLCAITHHSFGAKSEWKKYLSESSLNLAFTYKDDFVSKYSEFLDVELPILLDLSSSEVAISAKEMRQLTLLSLIDELKKLEQG
ncbi:MAG: GTPase [Crocinitomicaceae bacterium]